MLTFLYSDLGIAASYREMDGFGVHAFKWVNAEGQVKYVKYKWTSQQGVRGLTGDEAEKVVAKDWQHSTNDLYQAIRAGKYPSWELSVQMIDPSDLDKFDFNPLDATKIWPEKLVPSVKIGKMTVNRLPDNFFEETEQSAFSPGDLVPGIEASEDRLLQGRLFSYFDTQRHRVGGNFQQLAINRPLAPVNTGNQFGAFAARGTKSDINYEPSQADAVTFKETPADRYSTRSINGQTMQRAIAKQNNFSQAGDLYLSYSEKDRSHLIENLAGDLRQVKNHKIQVMMVSHFYKANAEYGTRLAKAVGVDLNEIKSTAKAD